jgi:effector-binding domain-containing protein
MLPEVVVETVTEQTFVAVRKRSTVKRIQQEIRGLLDAAWSFIWSHKEIRSGHNVAVYWDESGEGVVEVGVQVNTPFEDTEAVTHSATPAGTVAIMRYLGPYGQLGRAHEAVRAWCQENGRKRAGPYWEIYGDPPEDDAPAKYPTDVIYLLE